MQKNLPQTPSLSISVTTALAETFPEPPHGTANLKTPSSSPEKIRRAVLDLYDRIVDPSRFVRRVTVTANRVVPDNYLQFDLFSDPESWKKKKISSALYWRSEKNMEKTPF